ncbi:MAG: MoxR family ATPase [Candidatus Lokiarchaeota archaeon]|nr:MoxR family ATPase [Candidatus Lokiarchaeota archaeon]
MGDIRKNQFEQFAGSADYIASPELQSIVNVAIALGKPLLIRGEPGTGKTKLAHSIANALGKRLITWNIKSTTKAKDGCYVYDTVQRLNDARFNDKDISDIKQYIRLGPLGEAFKHAADVVLLIDEVDKADIEFPNDLLNELDEMQFTIVETGEAVRATRRPIVVITSNAEKELPDAFLRRCIFFYIEFPGERMMAEIVRVHYPDLEDKMLKACMARFYELRDVRALRKKPSTSELIDWIGVIIKSGVDVATIEKKYPFIGVLVKKEQDYAYLKGSGTVRDD